MPRPARYTQEKLDLFTQFRLAGLSNTEIGAYFGITANSVYHMVRRTDVPRRAISRPFWGPEQVNELEERLRQTPRPTYEMIAKQFGCSKNAIAGAIHRHCLKQQPPALPPTVITFPNAGCCMMPVNHSGGFHFCGAPAVYGKEGRVWCSEHRGVVYVHLKEKQQA